MSEQTLSLGFTPRRWQRLLFTNISKRRFSVCVLHRRAGKTFGLLKYLQYLAMSFSALDPLTGEPLRNPQFAFIAATQTAARRIVWNNYLKDFFRNIPGAQFSEKYLTVTFPIGERGAATIMLLGAETLEETGRGNYFDFVIVDEAILLKRGVLDEVVFPALEDRMGGMAIISTPKGKANELYRYWELAGRNQDEWYRIKLTCWDTGIFTKQQLDKMKDQIGPEAFAQEMECSFDVVPSSKIYEKQLSEVWDSNVHNDITYDSNHPVHVAMDLGMSDATTLTWFQNIGNRLIFLECFSDQGMGLEHYVKEIKSKYYNYGRVYVPADINVRELGSGVTRLEYLENFGLQDIFVIPKSQSIVEDIHICRQTIRRCYFHEDNCYDMLDAMNAYSRKYDDKLRIFGDKPLHDWSSHYSDCFRYAVLGAKLDLDHGYYLSENQNMPIEAQGFDPFGGGV